MTTTATHAFRVQRTISEGRCNCRAHPATPPRGAMSLPNELSSFVGRGPHLDAVAEQLGAFRLVTLTGGGGIGKTRLALQVARRLRSSFAECAWTALSALADDADSHIPAVVAGAFGGREDSGSASIESLAATIRERRVLLVLDNCEHVISACADLVMRLLERCPGVTVLATSREPLGVPGEVVYPVPPLECATAGAAAPDARGEAVQLFLERARARDPRLPLTPEAEAVALRICEAVSGVPLAIELAAACTSSMTLAQILDRLDDGLGLLRLGSRAAPARQQSLRASIEWSHRLLQESEQRLLRRLSALDDDFTLEAAEAVCAFDGLQAAEVAYLLERLVAQSLVHAARAEDASRFRLSAPVRQYGRERLDTSGETPRLQARLAEWSERPAAHIRRAPSAAPIAGEPDPTARAPRPAAPKVRTRRTSILSEREHAVVNLIAGGRSNREIADELVITKKTAEAHVSHILTKLGLCSRVQIATWSLTNTNTSTEY